MYGFPSGGLVGFNISCQSVFFVVPSGKGSVLFLFEFTTVQHSAGASSVPKMQGAGSRAEKGT
jgi:hypothetical protein